MNEQKFSDFQKFGNYAKIGGGLVYIGAVIVALVFYERLMADSFVGIARLIAQIGAFLVMLNAIALPAALHWYAVSKGHRIFAIIFYAGDIIIMALNLLASSPGISTPWILEYRQYAPASIAYVIAGWAILFMADPGQKSLMALQDSFLAAQLSILAKIREHVESDEGIDNIITPAASILTAKLFNKRTLVGKMTPLPASDTNVPDNLDMVSLIEEVVSRMQKQAVESNTIPFTMPHPSTAERSNGNGAKS